MVKKYTKTRLPKLRKIDNKTRKHIYKIRNSTRKRRLAINEGIEMKKKKTGNSTKKAAIAKKSRFNILRIYRKNRKPHECNVITQDMRYIDRKYHLGKTRNICKKVTGKSKTQRIKRGWR
jgi:hypothetical protein